jgi:hypothetical protein
VAIGGLLTPGDVDMAAACRPDAVCVVRGLGRTSEEMAHCVPALRIAIETGLARCRGAETHRPTLLHPVLAPVR